MRSSTKTIKILMICFLCTIVAAVLSVCLGAVSISPSEMINALTGNSDSAAQRILLYVRLPRTCGTLLAGAALSVSGRIIQCVLGNPLASPNIIGVNAGAGFFTVLCIALFPYNTFLPPFAAFLGALAAVFAVYFIARKTGASRITLVLAGIAVGALLNAGTDTITVFMPNSVPGITAYKIGGLAGVTFDKLSPAWIVILVGLCAALLLSRDLDVLSLGDITAKSLGLNVNVTRFLLLTTAAALAGAAVSFCGLIGFVGLIVPHAVVKQTGTENRAALPGCALLGATFLTVCDLVSRVLFAPFEIPLGIVVSYIGVPFFIYLILRKKGGKHGDCS